MAFLDVSELLTDPDFVDLIGLIHSTITVNALGQTVPRSVTEMYVGSVQPASGKTLMRLPEALRIQDVSSFWVKGSLVLSGDGKYPDTLIFKNKKYLIQQVFDWSNFGQGYTEGICVYQEPA